MISLEPTQIAVLGGIVLNRTFLSFPSRSSGGTLAVADPRPRQGDAVTSAPNRPSLDGAGEHKIDLEASRTVLDAGRTLMAWVRTALTMIIFGFTIYRFLDGLHEAGAIHLQRPEGPRRIGLFLVVLGTGSLLAGIVEYVQVISRVPGPRSRLGASFYLACVVLVLSILVLGGLICHQGPF
jgi:putative membrane protein